jgi:phage I-like protein
MGTVSLRIDLFAGGGQQEPPSRFLLFGRGETKTEKGVFLLDDEAGASCMAKYRERGVRLAIDYDHGSLAFISADPAESGKAAGWFALALEGGALWATNVEWTPKGAAKLRDREFRYISPAAMYEKLPDGRGRIQSIINCALTTNPAIHGAPSLLAASARGASSSPPPARAEDRSARMLREFSEDAEKKLAAAGGWKPPDRFERDPRESQDFMRRFAEGGAR